MLFSVISLSVFEPKSKETIDSINLLRAAFGSLLPRAEGLG